MARIAPPQVLSWLIPAALVALLVAGPSTVTTAAPSAGLLDTPSATAAALKLSGSAVLVAPGLAAPLARVIVPDSIMPHTDALCSVDTGDTPPRCSLFPSTPANRCSAHCTAGQGCSAFEDPSVPGTVSCSVFAKPNRACSVLQPIIAAGIASRCSASSTTMTIFAACSVMKPQNGQKCSSQNPSTEPGSCSAVANITGRANCSVLNTNPGNTGNRCSVRNPGTKTCSAYGDNTECSVLMSNPGMCTAIAGAPAGSCSTQVGTGFCSVILGSAGTFCVQ